MNLLIVEASEQSEFRLDFSSSEMIISPVNGVVSLHPVEISLKPITRDIFNFSDSEIEIEGAEITPFVEHDSGEISGSMVIRDEQLSKCVECGREKIYHLFIQSTADHGAELCFDCLEKIYVAAKAYVALEAMKRAVAK